MSSVEDHPVEEHQDPAQLGGGADSDGEAACPSPNNSNIHMIRNQLGDSDDEAIAPTPNNSITRPPPREQVCPGSDDEQEAPTPNNSNLHMFQQQAPEQPNAGYESEEEIGEGGCFSPQNSDAGGGHDHQDDLEGSDVEVASPRNSVEGDAMSEGELASPRNSHCGDRGTLDAEADGEGEEGDLIDGGVASPRNSECNDPATPYNGNEEDVDVGEGGCFSPQNSDAGGGGRAGSEMEVASPRNSECGGAREEEAPAQAAAGVEAESLFSPPNSQLQSKRQSIYSDDDIMGPEAFNASMAKLSGVLEGQMGGFVALRDHIDTVSATFEKGLSKLQSTVKTMDRDLKGEFNLAQEATSSMMYDLRDTFETLHKQVSSQLLKSGENQEKIMSSTNELRSAQEKQREESEQNSEVLKLLLSNVMQLVEFQKKQEAEKEEDWLRLAKLQDARKQQLPGSGTKLRLVVSVDTGSTEGSGSTDMLIVAYSNDFVSDVINSTLRRAMATRVVPEGVHPRQCNLYMKSPEVLLFTEDSLDDLGVSEGTSLKLVVESAESKAPALPPRVVTAVGTQPPPPPASHLAALPPQTQVVHTYAASAPQPPQASDLASVSHLQDIVLEEDMARRFCDREDLERRLIAESFRMELDPIRADEKRQRIATAKTDLHGVRMKLVDRATYSHNEVHRAAARGTLEKLNRVLENPLVSIEEMNAARRQSEMALESLEGSAGEDERVGMLKDAAKSEENRKQSAVEELKELVHVIEHRLRVPDTLWSRAEDLVNKANSCIILSSAMSRDEVTATVDELNAFAASVRGQ